MRIDLTPAQYEALDHPLFADDYTLREFPVPLVGDMAPQGLDPETGEGDPTSWAMSDPALTWEDEIVLTELLDERVEKLDAIKALPAGERADARQALRQEIRADSRKAARRDQRAADRVAARRAQRVDVKTEARVAARLAARQAEIDAEAVAVL